VAIASEPDGPIANQSLNADQPRGIRKSSRADDPAVKPKRCWPAVLPLLGAASNVGRAASS